MMIYAKAPESNKYKSEKKIFTTHHLILRTNLIKDIQFDHMESAKGQLNYKFEQFEVSVTPYSGQKLALCVIDPFQRLIFKDPMLQLKQIGTSTLLKALERTMVEIKMAMTVTKAEANTFLKIDIIVASQFLRPLQETIYINKTKEITQSQYLKQSIDRLSSRIKEIKENNHLSSNSILCNYSHLQEKSFQSNNTYEVIGGIKLPKGRHAITLSFLLKAHNAWLYIYQGNGNSFIANGGFYVANNSQWMPIMLNKHHNVSSEQQEVQFTTYYTSSYKVSIRNMLITSQKLE